MTGPFIMNSSPDLDLHRLLEDASYLLEQANRARPDPEKHHEESFSNVFLRLVRRDQRTDAVALLVKVGMCESDSTHVYHHLRGQDLRLEEISGEELERWVQEEMAKNPEACDASSLGLEVVGRVGNNLFTGYVMSERTLPGRLVIHADQQRLPLDEVAQMWRRVIKDVTLV